VRDDEPPTFADDPDLFGHWLPEHALWVAVVRLAVSDYSSEGGGLDPKVKFQASEWLFSEGHRAGTLRWVADHCSECPERFVDAVRGHAKRMRQKGGIMPKTVEPL